MADGYDTKIEILRKKSRTLLVKLAENSKIVNNEIEKLNIDRAICSRSCIPALNERATSSWRMRNDSTRVSRLLNPLNQDMTVGGRIVISSKHPGDSVNVRKPVSGCYCSRNPRKVQYRSARTISKPFELCHYCKSNFDISLHNVEEPKEPSVSTYGINAETLQRVQSITYTPRSEFLRRVQNKIAQHFNICPQQSETHAPLSCGYSSHTPDRIIDNDSNRYELRKRGGHKNQEVNVKEINQQNEIINISNESTIIDPHPGEIIQVPIEVHRANHETRAEAHIIHKRNESIRSLSNNETRGKSKITERKDNAFSPEIETILPPKNLQEKPIKSIPKKTISSTTKHSDEKKQHEEEKSSKSKKNVRKTFYNNCCSVNDRRKHSAKSSTRPDCCCYTDRCLSCVASVIPSSNYNYDKQVLDLRKFREKNYYDTHDSSQMILSSASLGSLEKFELNNRLFPESIGTIHKDNIMVSMPMCATKQLKRIHYFPRHIVREDKKKNGSEKCSKKCKQRSCPLTGHAIDVGLLRPARPANSLALKYQKGIM